MQPQIFIEVSDRTQVDGIAGLHARLLLRAAGGSPSLEIVGTASITEEGDLGTIESKHHAGLSFDDADILVRAACLSMWNAIMIEHMAAAGTHWQPLDAWLGRHLPLDAALSTNRRVKDALARVTGTSDAAK